MPLEAGTFMGREHIVRESVAGGYVEVRFDRGPVHILILVIVVRVFPRVAGAVHLADFLGRVVVTLWHPSDILPGVFRIYELVIVVAAAAAQSGVYHRAGRSRGGPLVRPAIDNVDARLEG